MTKRCELAWCAKYMQGLAKKRTHAVGDIAVRLVLLRHECQVENHPADHSGAKLHEGLDVHFAQTGNRDTRIELTADEPVVDDVAAVPTGCKLALLLVARRNGKRAYVDKDGERKSNQDATRENLEIVAVDEGPDLEVGAKDPSTGCASDENDDCGEECWTSNELAVDLCIVQ